MNFQYSDMGLRIKMRRKELGIRQNELAKNLGISKNHMSSIETGKEKPGLDVFIEICNQLNTTPDYLLLGMLRLKNVPMDITDMLLLCSPSDLILAKNFIKLLVDRNVESHSNNYF